MKPPVPSELDELNRVLLAVEELSAPEIGSSMEAVLSLCSSIVFGGQPSNHFRTLRLAEYAGYLIRQDANLFLTDAGTEFLELNSLRSYELTSQQEKGVAQTLFLSGPWSSATRDLLLSFVPNYELLTFDFDQSQLQLPVRYSAVVQTLKAIGVLVETGSILRVRPEYVAPAVLLRADYKGSTEDDLERALQRRRKIGALAEDAVVVFEQQRLKALGRKAEASLVRRISQLDNSAGYDIISFDGDKSLIEHDRFIEVKASVGGEIRFFWSSNERRVSEELGDAYWIYFVGNFRSKHPDQASPIMLQNPALRLPEISELTMETATYLITQSGNPILAAIDPKEVDGFLL